MTSTYRKLPGSIFLVVGLICCFGLNSVSAKPSAESPIFVHITNTEKLQSVLKQKGWDARLDTTGSLFVYFQNKQMPPTNRPLPSAFDHFAEALADRGWSVKRDTGGNLILRPGQPIVESTDNSHIVQETSHESTTDLFTYQSATDRTRLSQQLESVGWNTHFTHTGDLILNLPSMQPVVEKIDTGHVSKAPIQTGIESLAKRLEETGWITYQDKSGALIFSRPPLNASMVFTDETTYPKGKTSAPTFLYSGFSGIQPVSNRTDFSYFRQVAEKRGWTVTHDVDGSLILFPFG